MTTTSTPIVEQLITAAREYSTYYSESGKLTELLDQLADALEQQRKQLLDVLTADVSGTAVGLLKTTQQERDAARAEAKRWRGQCESLRRRQKLEILEAELEQEREERIKWAIRAIEQKAAVIQAHKEQERLREVLTFYGDESRYVPNQWKGGTLVSEIEWDKGGRAQEALK